MTNELINMKKVQEYLTEMADNARENGYAKDVEVIQSVQDHLLQFVDEQPSAPVSDEYYVRNKNAGYLGNSFIWYGKRGAGYTAYINGAERFSKAEAEKMEKEDPEKWQAFPCKDIDARLHLVFDSQDVKNLGTDNPCGWSNTTYAKL